MCLLECRLPGIARAASVGARDVFDAGEYRLVVWTDRVAAFGCPLTDPIPGRGRVLKGLVAFWCGKLDFVPNAIAGDVPSAYPEEFRPHADILAGRSMLVRRTTPLPVTAVVRGYVSPSDAGEYARSGTVGGHRLGPGPGPGSRLPETLFTAVRASPAGTREDLSWRQCRALLGDEIALDLRDHAIELYEHAHAHAARSGVIPARAEFEFGLLGDELVLTGEYLTPDTSLLWDAAALETGSGPPHVDGSFIEDSLDRSGWNRIPPAPRLPQEVVASTADWCAAIHLRITGLKA
jgi:phosphoribosylaminoimidazole-succinocarboxamide synthase